MKFRGSLLAFIGLTIFNGLLLVGAFFMALEALIVFGTWTGEALVWRVIWLLWPLPQLVGLVTSRRLWRSERRSSALQLSAVQAFAVTALDGCYLAYVFQ